MDLRFEQLGMATELNYQAASRDRTVREIGGWVAPAIAHRQIKFAFDDNSRPVAYWTWAWLTSTVEQRITGGRLNGLHESEWNEGDHLWFVDLVCLPFYLPDVISHIAVAQFPDVEVAHSVRGCKTNARQKLSVWRRARFSRKPVESNSLRYYLPPGNFADSLSQLKANQSQTRP